MYNQQKEKTFLFRNNIKKIRKEKNMRQRDLAIKIGIYGAALCELESGRNYNPTMRTMQRVADALNVSIAELFPR